MTGYEKSLRDDISSINYYIAMRILSRDSELKDKFESIKDFVNSIKSQLESDIPELTTIGNKTVFDWKKEAEYEIECEDKILELMKINKLEDVLYDRDSMSLLSIKYNVDGVSTPSQSLGYLKDVLKVKEPKKKKSKLSLFPRDDTKFIEDILRATITLNFSSPLHFYFYFYDYYKRKETKSKDWRGVANQWLLNGKYQYSGKEKYNFLIDNNFYVGEWDYENKTIETEDILFEDVDENKIAELIVNGNVKQIGVID